MAVRRSWLFFGAMIYLVAIAGIVAALSYTRGAILSELDNPEAVARWREWKESTRHQDGEPVTRRVPKVDEPPALVLFRDYFAAIVVTAIAIASFLMAFVAFIVRGLFMAHRPSTVGDNRHALRESAS